VTFGVCLHGAAVTRGTLGLHQSDRRAIRLGLAAGAQMVVLEAVGQRGSAPTAASAALAAGASRAVRLVDPALATADAHAAGFALATALDTLEVDLVLFGDDADPEGLHDVPACIAHHMSAIYLDDVDELRMLPSSPGDPSSPPALEVWGRSGGWLRRCHVPLNAVLGIAAPGFSEAQGPPALSPAVQTAVTVLSLSDLDNDPALVGNRHDRRGVVDPAARPLVTLRSGDAIAALLRR
jgi:hypothetical protein